MSERRAASKLAPNTATAPHTVNLSVRIACCRWSAAKPTVSTISVRALPSRSDSRSLSNTKYVGIS